jgi:CRISPR-associated protein Csm3
MKFEKNVFITGKIRCVTGVHIGGTKEIVEIGGHDNPVILDPRTRKPIIPGSSLKGKMRSLLEFKTGKVKEAKNPGEPHQCSDKNCPVCLVFGSTADVERGPTRLLVRDCFTEDDVELENKTENQINRLRGKAENPRTFERVPAGTEFKMELVMGVYEGDCVELLRYPLEALSLLENSYIGGSGTRGYGKVEFTDITIAYRDAEMYERGEPPETLATFNDVDTALAKFDERVTKPLG